LILFLVLDHHFLLPPVHPDQAQEEMTIPSARLLSGFFPLGTFPPFFFLLTLRSQIRSSLVFSPAGESFPPKEPLFLRKKEVELFPNEEVGLFSPFMSAIRAEVHLLTKDKRISPAPLFREEERMLQFFLPLGKEKGLSSSSPWARGFIVLGFSPPPLPDKPLPHPFHSMAFRIGAHHLPTFEVAAGSILRAPSVASSPLL